MGNLLSSPSTIAKARALDVDNVTKVDFGADTPRKLTVRASISDLRKGEIVFSDEIITIGCLYWHMSAHCQSRPSPPFLLVTLMCADLSTTWSANVKVHLKLTCPDGRVMKRDVEKTMNHDHYIEEKMLSWADVEAALPESCKDGAIVVEATFIALEISGLRKPLDVLDHTMTSGQFDCILVVDGRKVHVGKQVLAFHSPLFDKLFFGEEATPTKTEYTLDGVSHEGFVRLLAHLRTPSAGLLTEETVEPMLRVACKLQFQEVITQCEDLLLDSKAMQLSDKFVLADTFSLTELEHACLELIDTRAKAEDIITYWEGFKALSYRLKYAIAMRGFYPREEAEEGDEDAANTQ